MTPHGYTGDDCAQFDIGMLVRATMNSTPAMFYFLCYIYSSPSLLARLREEVSGIVKVEQKETRLNVERLNERCPLLVSAWQETLRLACSTVSNRVVLEDTWLNESVMLKKGGFVQMVCGAVQTDTSVWGDDAEHFNPERFLKSTVDRWSKGERKRRKLGFFRTLYPTRLFFH